MHFWQIQASFLLLEQWDVIFYHPPASMQINQFFKSSSFITFLLSPWYSLLWNVYQFFFFFENSNSLSFLNWCFNFSFFAPTFQFTSISYTWQSWKYTPFKNHFVKIHKTNHVNSRMGQKWKSRCVLNNVFNPIHSLSSILTKFEKENGLKKPMKNKKKQKNEQPWTLTYILVLQIISSFFLFCLNQLVFPPKWCHAN